VTESPSVQEFGQNYPFNVKCQHPTDDRYDPEWVVHKYKSVLCVKDPPCKGDEDCQAHGASKKEHCRQAYNGIICYVYSTIKSGSASATATVRIPFPTARS